MHNNCMSLYRTYGQFFVHGRVLEIGPDALPSSLQQVSANYTAWETADISDRAGLTYPGCNEKTLPMAQDTFDSVVAANVLEHVRFPWVFVWEIARVLQPGGHVVISAPSAYVYHAHPVDCWRVWPEGMRALFDWAELQVVTIQSSTESPTVIDVLAVGRKPFRRE